jgi:hypothetical protein
MSRYRALCLAFIICLIAAPVLFAHKDKDKDKEPKKEPKKEAAAKPSPTPQAKSHASHEQPPASTDSQHSSHSSSEASSANTAATTSHDHGDRHHVQETAQTQSSVHETPATSTNQLHGRHESATHNGHETATSSTYASHEGHSHYQEIDHARLHERMAVRPGSVERQHSYERSRVEREQFRRHVDPIRFGPEHRVVLTHVRIVPTTYHYRRTVFYDTYAWQPPRYVYGFYPRYGLWDATFLAFALDHIAEQQYALMFYHHQNEAELRQWMDDADRLAADNEDLRLKLDAMKAQMAGMQDSGVTADPSYVPPDAEDVALSPEVITQLTSK